jgi:hypothetical protein
MSLPFLENKMSTEEQRKQWAARQKERRKKLYEAGFVQMNFWVPLKHKEKVKSALKKIIQKLK